MSLISLKKMVTSGKHSCIITKKFNLLYNLNKLKQDVIIIIIIKIIVNISDVIIKNNC